jgi:hypothetical protein
MHSTYGGALGQWLVTPRANVDGDFEPAERFPCIRPFRAPTWVGILEANMAKGDEAVRALITDPALQKRLAKYLVHRCFRNSVLEDLHAGIAPDSKAGDYSDVLVTTPFGVIPWPKLSRFDDEEMKTLIVDVVQKTFEFIQELFDGEKGGELLLRLAARDPLPRWEDPR